MRAIVWLLMAGLGAGCATERVQIRKRWPQHREERDASFAELQRKTAELEDRVKTLETVLAKIKFQPVRDPAPAPPSP